MTKPQDAAASRGALSARADHIMIVMHDFASGGTERMAIRFANRWAQSGRKVTIICGDENGPARRQVDTAVTVTPLSPAIPRGSWSRIRVGRAAAKVARQIKPDVIFGPGNFHIPVLWALRALGGYRAASIVCKLSNPLTRPGRSKLGQWIFSRRLRFQTRRFTQLVALSASLSQEAERELNRQNIAFLPLPTLPDEWAPSSRRARTRTILCAGRLTKQKNFHFAIRSFGLLHGDYRLIILGEGPQREELEQLAENVGVKDRVAFLGYVPDTGPYLQTADVLFVTSLYEGCPAVVIEALANGVPVVTTKCATLLQDIMVHDSFGEYVDFDLKTVPTSLGRVADHCYPDPTEVAKLLMPRRISDAASAWLSVLDQASKAA
jgi:glycosyltransferase involved in cell wall biosynthesis